MEQIVLKDRVFDKYISYDEIQLAIKELSAKINSDYKDLERPLFLSILNGSFMFTSDLMKNIEFECEVSFVKIASYDGTASTNNVMELIGLSCDVRGRNVIIVEDIVESGVSIEHLYNLLAKDKPMSINVATLLFKPNSYRKNITIKYSAIAIPDDFIVGFGLDFDQLGRNLKHIYKIVK